MESIEHDFLGVRSKVALAPSQPHLQRRQSFRGISKMNPEIVRKVMAWASKPDDKTFHSNLPLYQPLPFSTRDQDGSGTPYKQNENENENENEGDTAAPAPLTIFYKGTVTVVDLPQDKADRVFKFVADQGSTAIPLPLVNDHPQPCFNPLDTPNDGELPIKRNKSLQRFFEKRKARLISASPCHVDHMSDSQLHRKSFT
ncbi:hypothetical protein vseg_002247 [Gypsophila vaccaria]